MKKFILSFLFTIIMCALCVASFIGGVQYTRHTAYYKSISYRAKLNKAYKLYMNGAEQLLDSLDQEYDWSDCFDNYDYYLGKHRVDSLIKANK